MNLTAAEFAAKAKLPREQAYGALSVLIRLGFAEQIGAVKGRRGKPATEFSINPAIMEILERWTTNKNSTIS